MATVTLGYNAPNGFISGETVTPAKLNSLGQPTISGIVNADIDASAAIALSKLATGALPTAITVANANLVSATAQSLVPAGAVMPFAMAVAPSGWLAADGTAVSRSTYATLFAAIGTTHGAGDGSTTFNLPDLRGIFVRGSGAQTISGTAYTGTFAEKQQDAFESHNHKLMHNSTSAVVLDATNKHLAMIGNQGANAFSYHLYGATSTPNTADSGSTGGTETRPANIALLYCIKF